MESRPYCKAYPLHRLRAFRNWSEKNRSAGTEEKPANSEETKQCERKGNEYLFLHENFQVTDGIHQGEHVVFDQVTEEWKEFCRRVLEFQGLAVHS